MQNTSHTVIETGATSNVLIAIGFLINTLLATVLTVSPPVALHSPNPLALVLNWTLHVPPLLLLTQLEMHASLLPHPQAASKYLKDTTNVHGTVNIYVGIGKGPGTGEQPRQLGLGSINHNQSLAC